MNTISMVGLLVGIVFLAWSGFIAIRREGSLRVQLELLQEQFAVYTRRCTCDPSVQAESKTPHSLPAP